MTPRPGHFRSYDRVSRGRRALVSILAVIRARLMAGRPIAWERMHKRFLLLDPNMTTPPDAERFRLIVMESFTRGSE